jgi:hypothetical protein
MTDMGAEISDNLFNPAERINEMVGTTVSRSGRLCFETQHGSVGVVFLLGR